VILLRPQRRWAEAGGAATAGERPAEGGALGFTGVARAAGTVAKLLFGVFLAIAVVLLVLGAVAV
jgi:uncharacterized membrane protein YtjA (UPF0391 family)